MLIQIGIDFVLILAFFIYLFVITEWNNKNKAKYMKQLKELPVMLIFKQTRVLYFICMAFVLVTIILVDWRIYSVGSYFNALGISLWLFLIYFTIFSIYQIGTGILIKVLMIFSNRVLPK